MQVVQHHQQVPIGGSIEHRGAIDSQRPEPRTRVAVRVGGTSGQVVAELAEHAGPRVERRCASSWEQRTDEHRRLPRWRSAASSAQRRLFPIPAHRYHREHRHAPPDCSSSRERPRAGHRRRPGAMPETVDAGAPALRCCGPRTGVGPLEPSGSWRSTAVCSERSSAPGSIPSSSASSSRTCAAPRGHRPVVRSASAPGPAGPTAARATGTSTSAPRARRPPSRAAEPERRDGPVLSAIARSSSSRARSDWAGGASSSSV